MSNIRRIYKIGPRKILLVGKTAAVYLGKDFNHLKGKKIMLTFEVLETPISR